MLDGTPCPDAIGIFDRETPTAVTVEFSPIVAASATCRRWQEQQQVVDLPGGGARITVQVGDLGEAVRWALGFGPEARVVAPPSAVALARAMLDRLHDAYAADAPPLRATRPA
jgi:predicted DNA-binding transcriptional regulator YafY